MYTFKKIYIHTYIHYITLHYIALQYNTLQYIALGGACCGREILSVSSICKRHQQSSKCIRMRASYNTEDSNDTSE